MKKKFVPNVTRNGYGFKYFINVYMDYETCACDEEGVEVYEEDSFGNWHYMQTIPPMHVDDIPDMTEEEFSEFLAENGI